MHAHFGLTAWPALAVPARVRALTMHGTDLADPRTRLATRAVLAADRPAGGRLGGTGRAHPGRARRARAQVLPCGVDTERFRPLTARRRLEPELGLDPAAAVRCCSRPTRRAPEKRSRPALSRSPRRPASSCARSGGVEPERVPLWVNAANAVLVPSEREGFGLAVLEALACDVPVLATPVGIHPEALAGVEGTLCAPFELTRWRAALEPLLAGEDPRVAGRAARRALLRGAMAERVRAAWNGALARRG